MLHMCRPWTCRAAARPVKTHDEDARRNVRDAVRGFLAASADMGTLDEILQEAGYEREGETWRAPEFVSMARLTMSIK